MKVSKTIKMTKTLELDGQLKNVNNDSYVFYYDDNPYKLLKRYHQIVEDYSCDINSDFSLKDFLNSYYWNWEEFIEFKHWEDITDDDDIVNYAIDYYKEVMLDIVNRQTKE